MPKHAVPGPVSGATITVFMGFRLLAGLLAAGVLFAQAPERPRVFAIKDATIVTVSSAPLEKGVIVLRDGLIEAVGPAVEIPPDAWVIAGEGLTVYPGFLDAMSTVGMPAPSTAGNSGPLSRGPQDRPATSPWLAAIDAYKGKDEDLEKWREGGFTTLALTPQVGIFPGQPSLVNLGDGPQSGRVVEPQTALMVRLPEDREGYSGYPGALLGRIAYVRQVFSDARWYTDAEAIYEANPVGLERPARDRAMPPVAETLNGDKPVFYPANTAIEIRRALRLAPDLGARAMVVYGGQQFYQGDVASEAAKAGLRALVDVAWPEAKSGADPEVETPLRVLEFRKQAPSSPAALAAAKVPFGFYSSKAKNPRELLDGVRKAVEAGLSQEQAIRALTLDAARLHGVDRMLGSLETGKIANLAVFKDDPFAEKSKPVLVFVDGMKYEVQP